MRAYAQAGYPNNEDFLRDKRLVLTTIDKLEEQYGLRVTEVRWNAASTVCTAFFKTKAIAVGMALLQEWGSTGYHEYATLQYLLGLRWRRGEMFRERSLELIGPKAVQAIMCHEYAHLLSYERYGSIYGRNHRTMFQATVSETYDFMFPGFGATDRFLDRKGDQWLLELEAIRINIDYFK